MQTNLCRRAFASGASLAALATPVVAFPTLAAVNASPDHELLVLGAQLDRAHDEVEAASDAFAVAQKRVLDQEMIESDDYFEAARQFVANHPLLRDLARHRDESWGQYDALAAQIVGIPAQTLAGLVVKAKVVQHSWPTCFISPAQDLDGPDERHLRHLVDELVRIASA
jgi:hypothetical protein